MYDSIFKRGKKGVYFCGQMQITVTFCVKMCHRVLPTCVRDSITSHKVQISLLIIEGGKDKCSCWCLISGFLQSLV